MKLPANTKINVEPTFTWFPADEFYGDPIYCLDRNPDISIQDARREGRGYIVCEIQGGTEKVHGEFKTVESAKAFVLALDVPDRIS